MRIIALPKYLYYHYRTEIGKDPVRGLLALLGSLFAIGWLISAIISAYIFYSQTFLDLGPARVYIAALSALLIGAFFLFFSFGAHRQETPPITQILCLLAAYLMVISLGMNQAVLIANLTGAAKDVVQIFWQRWGAELSMITALLMILLIVLLDPLVRLIKLEWRSRNL